MRKFDELNVLKQYPRIDFNEYFRVLNIPEDDKEKRVEMSEEITEVYDWLFALVALMVATQQVIDTEYLIVSVETRLRDIMDVNVRYVSEHIVRVANETVETTVERRDEAYYISEQRASEIAADEAHTFYNYAELQEAYENGATKKTWLAELDKKTRDSHRNMSGTTIPIDEMFQFDDCEMMVPHDDINGTPEQTVHCRCVCKYN